MSTSLKQWPDPAPCLAPYTFRQYDRSCLMHRNSRFLPAVALLLAWALLCAGCSVRSGTELARPQQPAGISLPSPSQLLAQRGTSAAGDELRSGAQFDPTL